MGFNYTESFNVNESCLNKNRSALNKRERSMFSQKKNGHCNLTEYLRGHMRKIGCTNYILIKVKNLDHVLRGAWRSKPCISSFPVFRSVQLSFKLFLLRSIKKEQTLFNELDKSVWLLY